MFEYKRKIFGFLCDIYGHLNNNNYLNLYEEARADALEKMGFSIKKLLEMNIHIYLTHIDLDFIKGVDLEDMITIKSTIFEMSRLSTTWKQKIFNSENELCNVAIVKGVFVKNGKPARISKELFQEFRKYSSDK